MSEYESKALVLECSGAGCLMEGGNGVREANGITQFAEGEQNAAKQT